MKISRRLAQWGEECPDKHSARLGVVQNIKYQVDPARAMAKPDMPSSNSQRCRDRDSVGRTCRPHPRGRVTHVRGPPVRMEIARADAPLNYED